MKCQVPQEYSWYLLHEIFPYELTYLQRVSPLHSPSGPNILPHKLHRLYSSVVL